VRTPSPPTSSTRTASSCEAPLMACASARRAER